MGFLVLATTQSTLKHNFEYEKYVFIWWYLAISPRIVQL